MNFKKNVIKAQLSKSKCSLEYLFKRKTSFFINIIVTGLGPRTQNKGKRVPSHIGQYPNEYLGNMAIGNYVGTLKCICTFVLAIR